MNLLYCIYKIYIILYILICKTMKITLWKKTVLNNLGNAITVPKYKFNNRLKQVPKVMQMLLDEYGTASNIKSKVNRLSVLSAITSTKERLKLYNNRKLENGLAIFCGTIIREDGKEKKINIDIEPHKPINNSLYMCDNKFHVEPLIELYNDEEKFGFLIMDGSGSLYGTVQGNQKNILHKFSVELPKKHRKGGQSSMRFARLRLEKRHAYITKVAEGCVHHFIKDDKVCVKGIIFGGSAEFKDLLKSSDSLDFRIKEKIISVVDIAYGGEQGFNQAIELAGESIGNVKLLDEKKILTKYFDEIAQDTGNYCFGVKDTMFALE